MATTLSHLDLPTTQKWHKWMAEHPIAGITLVGVLATQITTTFGYYLVAVELPSLAWPLFNGVLAAPATEFGSGSSYFVGLSFHYVNGIAFAILFFATAHSVIPLPNTKLGDVGKAVLYSVVLTIISTSVLIPLVYLPDQGYGFFSFSGPDGWELPFAVLLWHLVYGGMIGVLFSPAAQREVLASTATDESVDASSAQV